MLIKAHLIKEKQIGVIAARKPSERRAVALRGMLTQYITVHSCFLSKEVFRGILQTFKNKNIRNIDVQADCGTQNSSLNAARSPA